MSDKNEPKRMSAGSAFLFGAFAPGMRPESWTAFLDSTERAGKSALVPDGFYGRVHGQMPFVWSHALARWATAACEATLAVQLHLWHPDWFLPGLRVTTIEWNRCRVQYFQAQYFQGRANRDHGPRGQARRGQARRGQDLGAGRFGLDKPFGQEELFGMLSRRAGKMLRVAGGELTAAQRSVLVHFRKTPAQSMSPRRLAELAMSIVPTAQARLLWLWSVYAECGWDVAQEWVRSYEKALSETAKRTEGVASLDPASNPFLGAMYLAEADWCRRERNWTGVRVPAEAAIQGEWRPWLSGVLSILAAWHTEDWSYAVEVAEQWENSHAELLGQGSGRSNRTEPPEGGEGAWEAWLRGLRQLPSANHIAHRARGQFSIAKEGPKTRALWLAAFER